MDQKTRRASRPGPFRVRRFQLPKRKPSKSPEHIMPIVTDDMMDAGVAVLMRGLHDNSPIQDYDKRVLRRVISDVHMAMLQRAPATSHDNLPPVSVKSHQQLENDQSLRERTV